MLAAPILITKLYRPPPRPGAVPRPRLLARLDAGLRGTLTLVAAPAGSGKTTVVSAWVAGCGRPAAWLSLDDGDSDLARFLAHLVAALRTVAPAIGAGVLAALQSPQPPPIAVTLSTLLNELAALPGEVVLVLDDYHAVDAEAVHRALAFLVEHLPPALRLVVATREDPPLPLARLRARGQLAELRAADLRFAPPEAAEFLNRVMGLDLAAGEIAALEARTEGWIAGLQLAALSLQGRQDAAGFIASFTGGHHFILDYLVEEVLRRQPERVRSFLLQTAILDRLSGPLCDAVTGQGDGGGTLEALERGNLFVIPLDDKRRWYRYHHLFADVLRARSMAEQPQRVPGLHRRASEWYAQQSLPSDAVRHALAAEDFARAAGLIELAWPAMEGGLRSATWLGWVRALPDELVRARPVLCVGYAWALLDGGELEAVEARLRDAERWLDTAADTGERPAAPAAAMVVADEAQFRTLPATIATARARASQARGDVPGTVRHARRALDLLPEDAYYARGIPAALLAVASWASGDLEAAHRSFADFAANMRLAGNTLVAISGTFVLADISMAQGRLREAVDTYRRSLRLAAVQGAPVLRGTADLHVGLGELRCEQGDLEVAVQHLLTSRALGEHATLPELRYRSCLAMARIQEARGDLGGALDLLHEAERLYSRGPVPDVRPVAALKARVWVKQGRLAEALGWARERGLSAHDDVGYLREFEHVTLARVLIARYTSGRGERSIHEAMGLLERLLKAAEEGTRAGSAIEILVLQALAHEAQGNLPAALAPLARALTLAEPEGYVRRFVDEGMPMARLLSAAAARGILPGYTGTLLAACAAEAHRGEDTSHPPPAGRTPSLAGPLSRREREILQLIARGLSNREIGERLFLALDTVKGHNRGIFAKLGVRRRTEAVAKARSLNLLPPQ